MRLIDADKIKTIDYSGLTFIAPNDYEKIADYFYQQLIKNQPTACDVDKIVDELSNKMFSAELHGDEWDGQTVDNLLCMGGVYEIVKGGGVE